MKQYTIRKIPDYLDQIVREKARRSRKSLNSVILEAITRGLDAAETYIDHDMDDLAGTWVKDSGIDEALASFDEIDGDMWK